MYIDRTRPVRIAIWPYRFQAFMKVYESTYESVQFSRIQRFFEVDYTLF